jgi:hypothetical protein
MESNFVGKFSQDKGHGNMLKNTELLFHWKPRHEENCECMRDTVAEIQSSISATLDQN